VEVKTAITGASGHIGSALARELLAQGHGVRALVHRDARGLEGLSLETIAGDLSSGESLRRAFSGIDVVFHAAGLISISGSGARRLLGVNVEGTRRVVAACRAAGVRRLVHFSSVEALSAEPRDEATDEERPLIEGRSADPYAVSKAGGERVVREAAAQGLDAVILYPTGVIGPYDFKPSLLGRALIAIARGEFPALVAGGFDWVDVRDVARAAAAAASAEKARPGSRYMVGGRWASLVELASLVCALTGARVPRIVVPAALAQAWAPVAAAAARVSGTPPLFTRSTLRTIGEGRRVSWARAAGDLGYRPRALEQTVRDTCLWLAEAGRLPGVSLRPVSQASGEARG
jgi:dihydroflavonol-4-reductase